ncbi:MAG: carbohydrate binding family 9 domain-containing protein [Bacteroidales bacterium]|nr:carbohydrate binding family 9 domain-containing protein [Bacteroidales bacterium]
MNRRLIILLASLFLTYAVPGQELRIAALKSATAPLIDGRLDDEVWKNAIPFSEFRMVEPVPGNTPTELTEISIIYTPGSVIFGIRCHDSEPGKISALNMMRDKAEEPEEDQVSILLDPFLDKRTGYVFIVNPKGAKSEGFASGEHLSLGWDGLWDARCTIDDEGWTAEIAIPFLTVAFNPKLTTWGFNLERYIARKQEIIRFSGISLNSYFSNPADAGLLDGIEDIKQGLGVTFRPYGKLSRNDDKTDDEKADYSVTGGFDLYKNITPNLTAAITVNTDFAETEVDQRRINITRFPLYYPEKRTFFLEGSDIFEYGSTSSSTFLPFFSRRIGLYKGEQVPLDFGAKVFGKVGNTNISVLDVQSGSSGPLQSTNMFAGRVSQNILEESRVGVILTNGSQSGEKNTLSGADFRYKTSKFMGTDNFSVDLWGVKNWNEKKGGNKSGFGFKIDYPNDLIDAALSYTFFGDSIDPGLGFLPRKGYHMTNLGFRYMPRPAGGFVGDIVRQFTFGFRLQNYWRLNGDPESMNFRLSPLVFKTESGEEVSFEVEWIRDVLQEDFEVSDGVIIPVGDYRFMNYGLEVSTASHRMFVLSLESRFGEFYDGELTDISGAISGRFGGYVTIEAGANNVRGWMPQGNFTENVLFARLNLYLNPNLGINNYLQYDDGSEEIGYNGRLFWQIRPGNIIYLVYNNNTGKSSNTDHRYKALEDQVLFKIQMSIRF